MRAGEGKNGREREGGMMNGIENKREERGRDRGDGERL